MLRLHAWPRLLKDFLRVRPHPSPPGSPGGPQPLHPTPFARCQKQRAPAVDHGGRQGIRKKDVQPTPSVLMVLHHVSDAVRAVDGNGALELVGHLRGDLNRQHGTRRETHHGSGVPSTVAQMDEMFQIRRVRQPARCFFNGLVDNARVVKDAKGVITKQLGLGDHLFVVRGVTGAHSTGQYDEQMFRRGGQCGL